MMKFVFVILATASLSSATFGQRGNENSFFKPKLVKVKDWNQNTIMFFEGYFDQQRDTLLKQIGETELEKLKANSGDQNIPSEMAYYSGGKIKDAKEHYPKMDKLKLYKIATFTDVGPARKSIAVLRCPYSENKDWNSNVKWDTVYFVMAEEALEE